MRTLRTGMAASLFRRAGGDVWTGQVHSLSRHHECVPLQVGGERFVVEFRTPHFLTQTQLHQDIQYTTIDGGTFLPKLDHRVINVARHADDDGLRNLCTMADGGAPADWDGFARAVRAAVVTYYRQAPHAGQYFCRTDADSRAMVLSIFYPVPDDVGDRYLLDLHDELADPFIGFTLVSKAL